jgi:hypothetical protein
VSKTVDVDVSGGVEVGHRFDSHLAVDVPTAYDIDFTNIAKISIGIVDPITINPITITPLDVSVSIKEVPSLRTHVPANFTLGLSVLGYELACLRLCGEAQVINEPYVPNRCEICGGEHRMPTPVHPVPVNPQADVPR